MKGKLAVLMCGKKKVQNQRHIYEDRHNNVGWSCQVQLLLHETNSRDVLAASIFLWSPTDIYLTTPTVVSTQDIFFISPYDGGTVLVQFCTDFLGPDH